MPVVLRWRVQALVSLSFTDFGTEALTLLLLFLLWLKLRINYWGTHWTFCSFPWRRLTDDSATGPPPRSRALQLMIALGFPICDLSLH